MELQILGDRENIYQGIADEVVMPGAYGEVSLWSFHQPSLFMLKEGSLRVKSKDAKTSAENRKDFNIKDGLAIFEKNKLVIICNMV